MLSVLSIPLRRSDHAHLPLSTWEKSLRSCPICRTRMRPSCDACRVLTDRLHLFRLHELGMRLFEALFHGRHFGVHYLERRDLLLLGGLQSRIVHDQRHEVDHRLTALNILSAERGHTHWTIKRQHADQAAFELQRPTNRRAWPWTVTFRDVGSVIGILGDVAFEQERFARCRDTANDAFAATYAMANDVWRQIHARDDDQRLTVFL